PRSRLWDHMVLVPPGGKPLRAADEPILVPDEGGRKTDHKRIGTQGETLSILRPAGKARFGEEYLDVVSEGPFIDPGTRVEVVRVEGMRIVVRKVT
ncbi:MAG: NfeD family protein, partial [Planctomycetaceae bacterium]|nr:NfeD family protein [Planctomycetaceae bacterium]